MIEIVAEQAANHFCLASKSGYSSCGFLLHPRLVSAHVFLVQGEPLYISRICDIISHTLLLRGVMIRQWNRFQNRILGIFWNSVIPIPTPFRNWVDSNLESIPVVELIPVMESIPVVESIPLNMLGLHQHQQRKWVLSTFHTEIRAPMWWNRFCYWNWFQQRVDSMRFQFQLLW